MTELETRIMGVLRQANALTTGEIARAIDAAPLATQAALHHLDDSGHVILRNGFYRASAASRAAHTGYVDIAHD